MSGMTVKAADGRVLGYVVNPQVIPTWTQQTHLRLCSCRGELARCEAYREWLRQAS